MTRYRVLAVSDFLPSHCERCGALARGMSCSYFNTQWICAACDTKERAHPLFEKAREAEIAECKRGNFNFEGIGLPPEIAKK